MDEYVVDDSLVKPMYLIEIEPSDTDYAKYLNLMNFLLYKIKQLSSFYLKVLQNDVCVFYKSIHYES